VTTFLALVLIAGLVYTLLQLKAGAAWGPPVTVVLTVLLFGLTVVRMGCQRSEARPAETATVCAFEQVVARKAAEELVDHLPPGRSVLVFSLGPAPESHEAMVAGLEEVFSPRDISIAAVLPPVAPNKADPQRHQRHLEEALDQFPDTRGIIIYGSPVADMERFEPAEPRLPLALVAQRLSPAEAVARVQRGTATVVVTPRPGANWTRVANTADPERRFERACLLVTKANAAEVARSLK